MDFFKSQTALNLAKAFAGESQARTRYSIFARKARSEGFAVIADVFERVAQQELAHADALLARIAALSPAAPQNLNVDTGYPYGFYTTQDNLLISAQNERDLTTLVYPNFAQAARAEGFAAEAVLFDNLAAVERNHDRIFSALGNAMQAGTLYHSDAPVLWRCANCGYEQAAGDPWQRCPVCGHDQGFVLPQVLSPVLP